MANIDHHSNSVSKILTETLIAPGSSKRASWILELPTWAEVAATYRSGEPCACHGRSFYSIGSYWDHTRPTDEEYQREMDKLEAERITDRIKAPKHQSYTLGAREFTLTYSPKWFDDNEARMKMSKAIDKLIKYYKDEIINLRAVGEVGANGLSHVHCFYKLTGGLKITDKNFKRAWSHWNPQKKLQRGFEGGHHDTVKNESDFLGYIDKDADCAWLDKIFSK